MPQAWLQQWEESERGWGTRPDGYSLHLTEEDVPIFIGQFMLDQRSFFEERGTKGTPDEYTRSCGKPYLAEVDKKQFAEIDYEGHVNGKKFRANVSEYPKPIDSAVCPVWEAVGN